MMDNGAKYENAFKVIEILMEKKMSRVDLARKTGLTTAGIGKIVKNLIDLGFVTEKERISRNIGKPPTLLEIVPESVHVVGIGVGRDHIESCLTDAAGKILNHVSSSFDNIDVFTDVLYENIDSIFKAAKHDNLTIDAIGVGIPGIVNKRKEISEITTKFGNFEDIPISKLLRKKYKLDVYIENDADMAAIGEKWVGGGIHLNNLIYLLIDTGIGAGIIINGSIYQGEMGFAGEIGHTVVFDGEKFDYFENIYGIDNILESAKIISKDLKTLRDFKNFIEMGNEQILEIFDKFAKAIASIILSTSNITGIQNIFIGGKAKELGMPFLKKVKENVDIFAFPNHNLNVQFSNLGDTSIPLGAATEAIIMHVRKKIVTEKSYTIHPF